MISRRNIRIKVMQALYSIDSMGGELQQADVIRLLEKKTEESRRLFIYLLYFITETARYAELDARQRASKNLPTAEDLAVNTKIAGNEIVWKIVENSGFVKAVNDYQLKQIINAELLRKVYAELVESNEYKEYISLQERNKSSEKEILEYIFNSLMLQHELFISHIEEHFINWDDDAEMMQQLVINFLQKPNWNFGEIITKDKMDFARQLLQTVLDKKETSMELIKPKLRGWDSERIATLDLIILQMGVCELLFFETIPTKVTINEYIDLAKEYSTPQSGQFVNGLLDNIHKELLAQDKIHKINFKTGA